MVPSYQGIAGVWTQATSPRFSELRHDDINITNSQKQLVAFAARAGVSAASGVIKIEQTPSDSDGTMTES
jgi:hypothetical protein